MGCKCSSMRCGILSEPAAIAALSDLQQAFVFKCSHCAKSRSGRESRFGASHDNGKRYTCKDMVRLPRPASLQKGFLSMDAATAKPDRAAWLKGPTCQCAPPP